MNSLHSLPVRVTWGPGRVLPLCWVIWMCRRFDPRFDILGIEHDLLGHFFSHPPTPKRSFGVLKLPILTEFALFWPQIPFSHDLFGSNFHRPAAHPHRFSDRVSPHPTPPPPSLHETLHVIPTDKLWSEFCEYFGENHHVIRIFNCGVTNSNRTKAMNVEYSEMVKRILKVRGKCFGFPSSSARLPSRFTPDFLSAMVFISRFLHWEAAGISVPELKRKVSLHWRHNELDGFWNHNIKAPRHWP